MTRARTLPQRLTARRSRKENLPAAYLSKFSIQDGFDIGMDIGSPLDFTYEPPFVFTGKIERVRIELKPEK
jgi:hypothetical protein